MSNTRKKVINLSFYTRDELKKMLEKEKKSYDTLLETLEAMNQTCLEKTGFDLYELDGNLDIIENRLLSIGNQLSLTELLDKKLMDISLN